MSFVDQRAPGRDARGMTAAVILHGAVIAAVMLAPAAVQHVVKNNPVRVFNVDPPEPPPPPQQIEDAPAPPAAPLLRDKPIIEVPLPPVDGPTTSDVSPPRTLPIPGGTLGGTGTVIQPPIAEPLEPSQPPVMRAASRDPRYANAFQPPYPSALLRRELEGTATVRVLVGPDGRVSRVEIVSATHPDFGRATERQALSKWRFRPATEDGTPVPSWQTMTVRFTIT